MCPCGCGEDATAAVGGQQREDAAKRATSHHTSSNSLNADPEQVSDIQFLLVASSSSSGRSFGRKYANSSTTHRLIEFYLILVSVSVSVSVAASAALVVVGLAKAGTRIGPLDQAARSGRIFGVASRRVSLIMCSLPGQEVGLEWRIITTTTSTII